MDMFQLAGIEAAADPPDGTFIRSGTGGNLPLLQVHAIRRGVAETYPVCPVRDIRVRPLNALLIYTGDGLSDERSAWIRRGVVGKQSLTGFSVSVNEGRLSGDTVFVRRVQARKRSSPRMSARESARGWGDGSQCPCFATGH